MDMLLYSLNLKSTPLTLISMWAVAMHNIAMVGGGGGGQLRARPYVEKPWLIVHLLMGRIHYTKIIAAYRTRAP